MSQGNAKSDDVLQEKGTDASTPPTYKEQLDEAAIKVKDPQNGASEGGVIGQVVEKGNTFALPETIGIPDMRLIDIGRA